MRPKTEGSKVHSRKAPPKKKNSGRVSSPGGDTRAWLRSSPLTLEARDKISRFSASALPVFIEGEEGTGRSGAARAIHCLGPLKSSPFLRLSCRHLTSEKFIEKILLWVKGRRGKKISLTLYLENLETLDEELQILLLNLLRERRIAWPGLDGISFDIRFISSSTSTMDEAVAAKRFRRDLFEALGTLTLELQPLRERKEEIPRIACEILEENGKEKIYRKTFSSGALQALQQYEWPGNLAELESLVLRSAVSKDGDMLLPGDLLFRPPGGELRPSATQPEQMDPWFDVTLPTLAHEIKNPLVAINTFAHLLPEKYEDSEFRQEFSRLVNQDVRRINDLLENLLEFSQFSTARPTANDLNFVLAGLLKQKEKPLQRCGAQITADLNGAIPLVLFDETQLNFVLRNVLENAIAKIRPEAPLRLSTSVSGEKETSGPSRFVDVRVCYDGREGIVGRTQKAVGFGAEPDFQNLSLILLLIRKVMNRNRGRMQVRQEGEEGMAIRLQFPAAVERKET